MLIYKEFIVVIKKTIYIISLGYEKFRNDL